jgi:hypothetical protein
MHVFTGGHELGEEERRALVVARSGDRPAAVDRVNESYATRDTPLAPAKESA